MFYLKLNTYVRSFPRKNSQNLTLLGQSVRKHLSQYIVPNYGRQGKLYPFILPQPTGDFNFYSLSNSEPSPWAAVSGTKGRWCLHQSVMLMGFISPLGEVDLESNLGGGIQWACAFWTPASTDPPSTPNIWWLFQHQFSDTLIPSGYSTIQFNSDVNYPEWVQNPQVKGWVPWDCPPHLHTPVTSPRMPPILLINWL